jgi:hypothetical protein
VHEDVAIFLDSDVFFIKHFSIFDIFPQSTSRVLARRNPLSEASMHSDFISKSREILKIPQGNTNFHYNSSFPAVWYKDYVFQLQEYLSEIYNQHWQDSLFDAGVISEYNLYGIYVEEILQSENLEIINKRLDIGIWDKEDFQRFISNDFSVDKDILCMVVQSNLEISVDEYKKQINKFLERN